MKLKRKKSFIVHQFLKTAKERQEMFPSPVTHRNYFLFLSSFRKLDFNLQKNVISFFLLKDKFRCVD